MSLALRNSGIDAAHVDSRHVITTDDRFSQASPLMDLTNRLLKEKISPLFEQHQAVVMGGFIASTKDGVTSTLGRGGSDYTASLVGAALGAEEIQIWTDVDGVMTVCKTNLARRVHDRQESWLTRHLDVCAARCHQGRQSRRTEDSSRGLFNYTNGRTRRYSWISPGGAGCAALVRRV